MNKRKLYCNKEVLAIGNENSISDNKNKLEICFNCYDFIFCKGSKEYLQSIIKQKNIYTQLKDIIK